MNTQNVPTSQNPRAKWTISDYIEQLIFLHEVEDKVALEKLKKEIKIRYTKKEREKNFLTF